VFPSVCAFWCSYGARIKKNIDFGIQCKKVIAGLKCTDVLDADGVFKTEFFQECIGILVVISVL
jgi:hypothetical protein